MHDADDVECGCGEEAPATPEQMALIEVARLMSAYQDVLAIGNYMLAGMTAQAMHAATGKLVALENARAPREEDQCRRS